MYHNRAQIIFMEFNYSDTDRWTACPGEAGQFVTPQHLCQAEGLLWLQTKEQKVLSNCTRSNF